MNEAFREAAKGAQAGILAVVDEPLVSVDFRCTDVSTSIDSSLTMVMGARGSQHSAPTATAHPETAHPDPPPAWASPQHVEGVDNQSAGPDRDLLMTTCVVLLLLLIRHFGWVRPLG